MKKFWILPVTALMISCGAATEEAPAAEPVEEVAPVEEVVRQIKNSKNSIFSGINFFKRNRNNNESTKAVTVYYF